MELALPSPVEMVLEDKGKRTNQISVQEKLDLVQRVKDGTPRKVICKEYGIPTSTLSSIIKNDEKYRSAFGSCMVTGTAKRVRIGHYPLLEGLLRQWAWEVFHETGSFNASLQQIKEKAQELAPSLGLVGFKGGHSWVSKVAQRLRQALLRDPPDLVITPNIANFKYAITDIFKLYTLDDIFFADEIGLFYRLMPDDILQYVDQPCKKGDKASDRITVLATSNMTGKEKLRLLVVSRLKFPKTTNPLKTLPVVYEQDVNSWMTKDVFHNWITQLDHKMTESKRKIVLFVRNSAIHSRKEGLKAVRLEYVPKGVFTVLQDILRNLKLRYRQRLLEHTLLNLEYKKPLEVTLLRCLYILASVWADIKSNQIGEAFVRAGFVRSSNSLSTDNDKFENELESRKEREDLFRELRKKGIKIDEDVDFNSYCSADDSLVVSHSLADIELLRTEVDCEDMIDIPEMSLDEDDFADEQQTDLLLFPKMTMTEIESSDSFTREYNSLQEASTSSAETSHPMQEIQLKESLTIEELPQKRGRGRPKKISDAMQSAVNMSDEISKVEYQGHSNLPGSSPFAKKRAKRRFEEPSSSTPNWSSSNSLKNWPENGEHCINKSHIVPYCSSVTRFEEVLEDDDVIVVKHAVRPMARHHFVLVLKNQELNIGALDESHISLIHHMHTKALDIAKSMKDSFLVGFHAVPSIIQLTMHMLSLDLCSTFMDSKALYNSFTTQYFISSKELLDQLRIGFRVDILSMAMVRETLQTPLRCHICEIPQPSIELLKNHLLQHVGNSITNS